ncbi:Eco57I restriction-modification methylase domain-containing protein [Pontibacter harenae]|uniref:Eco57I restriction-modification methylase domain-containing protein n=1 Tax=Pontibacter harenae TaxID=2894083 RepID=UPI001E2FBE2A|nr:Eco57I restriction-modification methylase domain-containing protein [Pontibacter harenae]MCC9166878.1 Eco57I restriction-modification methylase domain-containing protein [Pontibacter harenae]
MIQTSYNPDVLTCLANLSNDEVFTPPNLVNEILDLLPKELWSSPEVKFLDPVSKSGVFLREIAKRLMKGLEAKIPDKQERINHVFTKQLYAIAITELTSLLSRRSVYCSKTANGKYSICEAFDNEQGNIHYERMQHLWENGKCAYCGASQEVYDRDDALETYAYNFIHTDEPESIFDMKFDVIVGNPPYQLSDGGHGRSASPIYHKFVEQAKKLNPRYLTMIIPARWYAGGKGLDDFRREMLEDSHIRKLVDYENSNDVFPGVDVAGGICYFLRERDSQGLCEVTNFIEGKAVKSVRALNEFSILIRHSKAVPIIRKVKEIEGAKHNMNVIVSPSKPFGIRGHHKPSKVGIPCYFTQRQGLLFVNPEEITDNYKFLDKYKLLIPRAPIAGQTDFSKPVGFYYEGNVRIAKPGEACTESWLVAFASKDLNEVVSFKSYLFSKIFRFLLLQSVVSQDVTRNSFQFIPHLGKYEGTYTDEILRKRWGITEEEWSFIDSRIKDIGGTENKDSND